MTEVPRASRRRKPGVPGQKFSLGLRITGETKQLLEREADATGRTQSEQATHCIYWYFEHVRRFGGPRSFHLFMLLAETAQVLFPNEDDWLNDRASYDQVLRSWTEVLDHRAPPPIDRKEQIASAREVIDEMRAEHDPARREQLRAILLDLSIDPRLPSHIRLEAIGAATLEVPGIAGPSAEAESDITLEDKIVSGRRLAAELVATGDPQRQAHLQGLLTSLSRVAEFPDEVREEFRRAVSAALPEPSVASPAMADAPILPPPPARPTGPTRLFHDAWVVARQLAFNHLGRVPSDREIAQVLVSDGGLILHAELHLPKAELAFTAEGVLAYRTRLFEHGLGPPPERTDEAPAASPPPRPAKRRRAPRGARHAE